MQATNFVYVQQFSVDYVYCEGRESQPGGREDEISEFTRFASDEHLSAILTTPHDVGLWISIRLALESDVRPLTHHQIIAGLLLKDHGRHFTKQNRPIIRGPR